MGLASFGPRYLGRRHRVQRNAGSIDGQSETDFDAFCVATTRVEYAVPAGNNSWTLTSARD